MAFDQNSIPKDLRPINVARTVADDQPRTVPMVSSGRPLGFYQNPPLDTRSSPGTVPPIYGQSTIPDSGYLPLGYNNAAPEVAGWVHHVVPSQPQPSVVNAAANFLNPSTGYTTSPNFGAQAEDGALDRSSEEGGGDGSVSGRKVKFLCSFGGKILPRPSDGALRYVGGQTRIISVRRDISFGEFVQRMTDACPQNSIIKYQLPDEDLDALVSVSCPDDLENMMDEYKKLVEGSSDGSAKLRIFLFSPSELESAGSIHLGDLQDGGQKYIEAVNGGMFDGFSSSSGDRIARKESIESAASGQNSDFSGTEGADSCGIGLGEVNRVPSTGGLSPSSNNSGLQFDTTPRTLYVESNSGLHTDSSAASLGIPVVKTGPSTTSHASSEQEIERSVPHSVPQLVPVVDYPASSPHFQGLYLDHRQETSGPVNYVQVAPGSGFPAQVMGVSRPVFTQQQAPTGAFPNQFIPTTHMTMNPSLISMNPNMLPAFIHPNHIYNEHFHSQNIVGHRAFQIPSEQGYNSMQHPQVPQQTVFPVFADCHMCQKALPHAHSDTVAQEQRPKPSGAYSDSRSTFHSLHLDNRERPLINPLVPGAITEANMSSLTSGPSPGVHYSDDQQSGKVLTEGIKAPSNIDWQGADDKILPQKAENPDFSKVVLPQGVFLVSGVQSTYNPGAVNNTPQAYQPTTIQHLAHPQLQVTQGSSSIRPLNNDFASFGMPFPSSNTYIPQGSPKEYQVNVASGSPKDDSSSAASENLRQIDSRLENLQIRPSEIVPNVEHNNPLPSMETFEVSRQLPSSNLNIHQHPVLDDSRFAVDTISGNPVCSGVESASHKAERFQPASEWKDSNASYRVGDAVDNSASLFVNQDPWNLQSETPFPPPKPSKLQIKREVNKDSPADNRQLSSGELASGTAGKDLLMETPSESRAHQPFGNLNQDFSSEHSLSNADSAEDLIKQELQTVAESVAASVLHTSVPSNPDVQIHDSSSVSRQSGVFQHVNADIEHTDKSEDVKTKLSEKMNFGFPASEGIGRLQIIKNSDLEELRELGSGTFGTVYHGKWRGTDVAIKRINDRCFAGKPSEQDRMRDDFWNEAIKLADLHHPNVVAFYGVVLDGPDGSVATVTEYMVNGSLRNALQKSERNLDKRKRLLIGMDVAFGMEYLHGKNIVHFDLKSDNLLVNLRDPHRPICKVGDLGLSKVKCHTLISGGVRGTLPWMAPELLNGSSSLVSEKVDVFSFGIVMWELLTGEEPYADLHYGAIIGGIVSNTLRPLVPEGCDPDWRDLMQRCWSSEPSHRPTFIEIANELRAMATKLPTKQQQQPINPN